MSQHPERPSTPAEAQARLDTLMGTEGWTSSYLSGSSQHVEEFNKLQELALSGNADKIDAAIAGDLGDGIFQDKAQLDNVKTIEFLRAAGIDDKAVIKQVLSGEAVSQQEVDAAKSMRNRLERDHDWQKRFLAGDGDAVRQMQLLNVILTRPVKRGAAA